MGAGALGTCMDDFNGDNYDFAKAGFIGGGGISCGNSARGRSSRTPRRAARRAGAPTGRKPWSTTTTTPPASAIRAP